MAERGGRQQRRGRNLLVHNLPDTAIQVEDAQAIVDVYDNIVYASGRGFQNVTAHHGHLFIANNTIHGSTATGGITANGALPRSPSGTTSRSPTSEATSWCRY